MSSGENLYLLLVFCTFAVFAVSLAYIGNGRGWIPAGAALN